MVHIDVFEKDWKRLVLGRGEWKKNSFAPVTAAILPHSRCVPFMWKLMQNFLN